MENGSPPRSFSWDCTPTDLASASATTTTAPPFLKLEHELGDAVSDAIMYIGEDLGRPIPKKQCFFRASCWTICSATAVYTSKRLMVVHGYHYPLTIAFRSFSATSMLYLVLLYISAQAITIPFGHRLQGMLRLPEIESIFPNRHWAAMIPASSVAAASFPMVLEGFLHMPSLPVLVMLFPIIYAAEALVLVVCCYSNRTQHWPGWEISGVVVMISAVLYNENRLMVPGLIWGVSGVLLIGVARAFFTIGFDRAGRDHAVQTRLNAYHGFVIMTLAFGITFSGAAAYQIEHVKPIGAFPQQTLCLILVNLVAIIGASCSGTFILAFSPISLEHTTPHFSSFPIPASDFLASSASNLVILLVAFHSSPVSYVSWIQTTAYLGANILLAGRENIHEYVVLCMDSTQQQVKNAYGSGIHESHKPSRYFTSGVSLAAVIFFACVLSFLDSSSIDSLPPSLPSNLDTTYRPDHRFDIVISMFEEDPAQVRSMIRRVKSLEYFRTIRPRVIIYTKSQTADLTELKTKTGATTIERLENLGREGGTYLWHIVNKWDSLARQTMFIQAHAHNARELMPRIDSYLVPETGMLSLGFTGVTCDCERCADRWGWEDTSGVVPGIYKKLYSQACTPATPPISLTYKGQFVASAQRIRGIGRLHYESLLTTITSREASLNGTTIPGAGYGGYGDLVAANVADTPDNPIFGFTMERIWGLLMQCGTDPRIAAMCPSLLGGMGRAGRVRDCQCLDEGV